MYADRHGLARERARGRRLVIGAAELVPDIQVRQAHCARTGEIKKPPACAGGSYFYDGMPLTG
jgi:hypothetical protein